MVVISGSVIALATRPTAFSQGKPQGKSHAPPDRSLPRQTSEISDADEEAAYLDAVGRRTVQENCLICHEENMITRQRLTTAQWEAEIEKMLTWGAPLPSDAKQPLVDYLARHYSDREPLPAPLRMRLKDIDSLERPTPAAAQADLHRDPSRGERLYATNCANCHGPKALGAELGPSLVDKAILAHPQAYHEVVRKGLRRMPGFQQVLNATQEEDLLSWLRAQRYP
jgi:ubiquinol-cytochrome c reductase cytochrome c subunit